MAVTPRLGLYKPVGVDLADIVAHLDAQLDIIDDRALNTLIAPNASPPTAQFVGQEWFTDDTLQYRFWDGAAWQLVTFSPASSGAIGPSRKVFNQGNFTGSAFTCGPSQETGPLMPTTFNVGLGKTYKIKIISAIKSMDTTLRGKCFMNVRIASGVTVDNTGTLLKSIETTVPNPSGSGVSGQMHAIYENLSYTADVSAQITLGLFINKTAGFAGQIAFAGTDNGPTNIQHCVYIEEM